MSYVFCCFSKHSPTYVLSLHVLASNVLNSNSCIEGVRSQAISTSETVPGWQKGGQYCQYNVSQAVPGLLAKVTVSTYISMSKLFKEYLDCQQGRFLPAR